MALRSIEGTVQIQNTCNHLHYLVLENSQYLIGNVLDPMVPVSWSWRAFKHQISALFFFFCVHTLSECSICNLPDSVRGLSSRGAAGLSQSHWVFFPMCAY